MGLSLLAFNLKGKTLLGGLQVLYIAHVGDSGAVMACKAYDLHFPLRLTTDHKPNRPDEHARIQGAGGSIDERHNRVISEPKSHNGRVTLLSMSRCGNMSHSPPTPPPVFVVLGVSGTACLSPWRLCCCA